jgi:hypothetical protein
MAEAHTETGPVIDAGVGGTPVSANVLAVLAPQALLAITDKVPVVKPDGTVIVMEVPVLAVIVHPVGAVQL